MAAVKRRDADTCVEIARAMAEAGLTPLLGHNHVQEAAATTPAVRAARLHARVHFIGHIQTNKINQALTCVDAIDTIDSVTHATAVAKRVPAGRILDCMVEVNCSGEPTKFGVAPAQAAQVADAIAQAPSLRLTGLMTVGALSDDESVVRRSYARLRELREQLTANHPDCTELSMGMSGDFALAIAEGATLVRIGQALFGPRRY